MPNRDAVGIEFALFSCAIIEASVGLCNKFWSPSYSAALAFTKWWFNNEIPFFAFDEQGEQFSNFAITIWLVPGFVIIIAHLIMDVNETSTWLAPMTSSLFVVGGLVGTSILNG